MWHNAFVVAIAMHGFFVSVVFRFLHTMFKDCEVAKGTCCGSTGTTRASKVGATSSSATTTCSCAATSAKDAARSLEGASESATEGQCCTRG